MRIYTDRQYLPPDSRHVYMLFPFWGMARRERETHAVFEKYVSEAPAYFQLVPDVHAADVVVLPASWPRYISQNCQSRARQLAALAADAGKPMLVFTTSDRERDLPFEGLHFRPSNIKSQMTGANFSAPGWTRDILLGELNGQLVIRPWRETPVVGFCGRAQWGISEEIYFLRQLWGRFRNRRNPLDAEMKLYRWPSLMRKRVVRSLSQSPFVKTNFILNPSIRESFSDDLDGEVNTRHWTWKQFDQNMLDSDYMLCIRGHGNYSFRFYESLSAGRIPIFVNTDCALPYDWFLQWKDCCVWVEQHEIPMIGEKVAEFHNKLSPQDFTEIQHTCRRMWAEWVSPEGFFKNFHRHLEA